jgi:protein-S-isoprenylcysteine O-methyltransferase Ste14
LSVIAREVDFPPVWLAAFAAIGGIAGWFVPLYLPHAWFIGSACVVVALLLVTIAILQMAWARTSVIPGRVPTRMVTTGIFRLSRNPIYLADALLLAGLYLFWGALVALPLVAVFMWVITQRFIRPEEALLRQKFGAEFVAYRNRTRRWL